MGSFSIWHLLILLAVVLVVFGGGGKISKIMGDVGKGITSFKSGLKDEETRKREEAAATETIDQVRPVGATVDSGVRQDDVVRR